MADQDLRIAKYFTLGISSALMLMGGGVWPFIWWEMYSSGRYNPPTQAERLELRVQDSAGQQHILHPMDLFTIDDDSSRQSAGYELAYQSIVGTDEQKAIFRPYLIRHVEFLLDTEIHQIEAWQHIWTVDFDQHPPIDIDQPAQVFLMDSFSADSVNVVLSP